MNTRLNTIFTIALLFGMSLTTLAQNGVMISSKSTNSGNEVTNSKVYMTQDKLAIKNSGKDNSTILFDAKSEVFTYIDNNKKEYYQFDKPTLVQLKEQIKMMVQMMKAFAAQMPEEQRKKIDQLTNPESQNVSYKASGNNATVGKWKTVGYDGYNNADKIMSVNIATYSTLNMGSEKFVAMSKMVNFFKENLKEVASLLPSGSSFSQIGLDDDSPIVRDGMPVKTITYEDGKIKDENLVDAITEMNLPDSHFSIPSGYARKTIDMQKQLSK